MDKKSTQLGQPHGTANARLRKKIIFHLMQKVGLDSCFQCREKIEDIDHLSIEHKVPWLDSQDPVGLFFDIENIAFSHISCNVSVARHPNQKWFNEEDRYKAKVAQIAKWKRDHYTPEARRERYLKEGR